MADYDVTVGGITISDIFDVNYDGGKPQTLGKATIVCANNTNNRAIESGDEVVIDKNGTTDYKGYVVGKPTKAGASRVELEINAVDKRAELKHQRVNRVFYQMDTGAIIREVVNEKLSPYNLTDDSRGNFVFRGEETNDWNTDIPRFSLADIALLTLENVGNNFLFLGWPSGTGNESPYKATYTDVPNDTIPGDGQVDTLFTRLAVNNKGGVFSLEIDLRDSSGNNYIWNPELPETGFVQFELKAENAVTEASIGDALDTDERLEYRFAVDGQLPGSRAVGIDYASVIPFGTVNRSTDLSPSGVEDTSNIITRRIERSAYEMIKEFAIEDGNISYVDTDDILYYEQSGQQQQPLTIDFNSTSVVDATFDRDYQDVVNRVTVQGDDDIRVTVEDTASVDFYGIASREEPIIDKEIQTEEEAINRGNGYLSSNAWDDEAIEFVIADSDYSDLTLGEDITVNWPPENVTGTYVVSNVETDRDGLVTVQITKRGTL